MDDCETFLNICRCGNLLSAEKCLGKGISPNVQNIEGASPLQVTAANGFTDLAELLLEKGAFIDLPNNYGWTPLMHAARHGHLTTVSLLLKMKAKVNISNKLGMRPIDLATWSGNFACVKLLIDAGAVVDNVPSSDNENNNCQFSALMAAALQGHETILRILLEEGAPVNQVSPVTGLTPIMFAACSGHKYSIQTLIEWGGDANKVDICGKTALDFAIYCNRKEVRMYLENMTARKPDNARKSEDIDILQAVKNGDVTKVKALVELHADLSNFCDPSDGITPLMLAAMLGHSDIMDLLISSGANLDSQDKANGWTALMYAVFYKHADVVQLLIAKGANVYICSHNGHTVIDLARHLDCSELDILKNLSIASSVIPSTEMFLSPDVGCSKKMSSGEKLSASTYSQFQTPLKDWIGALQQKMSITQSPKSPSLNTTLDSEYFDDIYGDVFLENNPSFDESFEGSKINVSKLLPPNQYLSSTLKEHTVEALTPPAVSNHANYVDFIQNIMPRKSFDPKLQRRPVTSLRVPNLLKGVVKRKTPGSISGEANHSQIPAFDQSNHKENSNLEVSGSPSVPSISTVSELTDEQVGNISEKEQIDLTTLLNKESLKKYVQKFKEQEIDVETFCYLTKDDLNEMGIQSVKSCEELVKIINSLRKT